MSDKFLQKTTNLPFFGQLFSGGVIHLVVCTVKHPDHPATHLNFCEASDTSTQGDSGEAQFSSSPVKTARQYKRHTASGTF